MHHLLILLLTQSSVLMGNLAYSYTFPFEGIIGCSPGVYGLLGADLALLCFYRELLDPLILFVYPPALMIHLVLDTLLYFYAYDAQTGYIAHLFGLVNGFAVMLLLLYPCHKRGGCGCTWGWSLLGAALSGAMTFFLLGHYLSQKTPYQCLDNANYSLCCSLMTEKRDR